MCHGCLSEPQPFAGAFHFSPPLSTILVLGWLIPPLIGHRTRLWSPDPKALQLETAECRGTVTILTLPHRLARILCGGTSVVVPMRHRTPLCGSKAPSVSRYAFFETWLACALPVPFPVCAVYITSLVACSRAGFVPFRGFHCVGAASPLSLSCLTGGECGPWGLVTWPMRSLGLWMPGCSSCHVMGILHDLFWATKTNPMHSTLHGGCNNTQPQRTAHKVLGVEQHTCLPLRLQAHTCLWLSLSGQWCHTASL